MIIRIDEALARAKRVGRKMTKKELAAKLWPDSPEASQVVNIGNLCSGRTSKIDPEWVIIISKELDVTPNFLFGLDD